MLVWTISSELFNFLQKDCQFCYHQGQGQGHCEGSYSQSMIVSTISLDLLIPLQSNLVWPYIIISRSVLLKDWIAMFKVKGTVLVQNFTECLLVLHFLYHWCLCNQTRCAGVLLIMTSLSANKVRIYSIPPIYSDLQYLGIQHGVFCHTRWQTLFELVTEGWHTYCETFDTSLPALVMSMQRFMMQFPVHNSVHFVANCSLWVLLLKRIELLLVHFCNFTCLMFFNFYSCLFSRTVFVSVQG